MKIVIIGASGTIGKAVTAQLAQRHEIIEVGSRTGAHQADMSDIAQVRALFQHIGRVDAVVVTAGKLHFGPLAEFTPEQFQLGLDSKLMGQVNVALVAQEYLNDGGSITLTSGIVAEQPIRFGAAASMTNAAVEGFVRGAAIELARGVRINVVSPTVLEESLESYGPFFYGFEPAAASRVALAYSRSVEGAQTGQVYRVW
ncbi:Sepiapterin reductase [compost metagenome]|uniref:Short chain dehydrogenase n=1 Tax=Janthinobacterium lividum TaxID=29581 RepID=A0A5C4NSK2_9BURK|nr:short chain dehydrogenase [Janthinobacterium lividum]TNC76146.1 short chain dehydrogenase [Janthinobacterium lividum]